MYVLSRYLGVPFLVRYGKYIFIRQKDIEQGQAIFDKYGGRWFVLFSRVIPGVRGLIPIAAGVAKMNFLEFSFFTFIGSSIYIFILAFVGYRLGDNWERVNDYLEYSDYIAVVLLVIIFVLIIYYIRKNHKKTIWDKIKKLFSWLPTGK